AHVNEKIRQHWAAFKVHAADGIHEIQVRDRGEGRRWRLGSRYIIGDRRAETGIAHELAGGFVVAKIVHRRGGENQLRRSLAQNFSHPPAGSLIAEDAEIPELRAAVLSADERRRTRILGAADGSNLIGRMIG